MVNTLHSCASSAPRSPSLTLLPWQSLLSSTAELFVCPGKWHDDRGGNRKHNRLPDRLIPQAWPETGTEPVSNQREITRGGSFVCSAYTLIFTNIVILMIQQMCGGFDSSNLRDYAPPLQMKGQFLHMPVCIKCKVYAVHNNIMPVFVDARSFLSSLVDLLQLKQQRWLSQVFSRRLLWLKATMTVSQLLGRKGLILTSWAFCPHFPKT